MNEAAIVYGSALIAVCGGVIGFCIALLISMQKHGGYSRKIPMPPTKLNPKNRKQ